MYDDDDGLVVGPSSRRMMFARFEESTVIVYLVGVRVCYEVSIS
jgi:hypothetical protein